jgi:hypothetical protein
MYNRGVISEFRSYMQKIASWYEKGVVASGVGANVQDRTDIAATLSPLVALIDRGLLVNGQVLTGVAPTGTYTSAVTFTVTNGLITAIVLS